MTPAKKKEELPPDATLDEIADQFQAGYRVKLHRYDAKGDPNYLDTIDLNPLTLETDVRDQWGGGKFRGMIYKGGDYQRRMIRFSIEGPPIRLANSETAAAPLVAPVPQESALDRSIARLVELMTLQHQATPTQSGISQVKETIETVMPLIRTESGGGVTAAEHTAAIAAAELRGETRAKEHARELAELRELINTRTGSDSPGVIMAQTLSSNLPEMLGMLKLSVGLPGLKKKPAAQVNPPATADVLPNAVAVPPGYEWLVELRPLYPYLAGLAMGNDDAGDTGRFAVNRMPAEMKAQVIAVLDDPELVNVIETDLANHLDERAEISREWLDAFVDAMVTKLRPPAPPKAKAKPAAAKKGARRR